MSIMLRLQIKVSSIVIWCMLLRSLICDISGPYRNPPHPQLPPPAPFTAGLVGQGHAPQGQQSLQNGFQTWQSSGIPPSAPPSSQVPPSIYNPSVYGPMPGAQQSPVNPLSPISAGKVASGLSPTSAVYNTVPIPPPGGVSGSSQHSTGNAPPSHRWSQVYPSQQEQQVVKPPLPVGFPLYAFLSLERLVLTR